MATYPLATFCWDYDYVTRRPPHLPAFRDVVTMSRPHPHWSALQRFDEMQIGELLLQQATSGRLLPQSKTIAARNKRTDCVLLLESDSDNNCDCDVTSVLCLYEKQLDRQRNLFFVKLSTSRCEGTKGTGQKAVDEDLISQVSGKVSTELKVILQRKHCGAFWTKHGKEPKSATCTAKVEMTSWDYADSLDITRRLFCESPP